MEIISRRIFQTPLTTLQSLQTHRPWVSRDLDVQIQSTGSIDPQISVCVVLLQIQERNQSKSVLFGELPRKGGLELLFKKSILKIFRMLRNMF